MNARTCCLLLLSLLAAAPGLGTEPVQVTVDCSRTLDKPPILWGHVNVSRRAPPPKELCGLIEREFGRPEVTRCWLMLDQAWDYRTDTYRFDYEINKDYYEGDAAKKRYGVQGFTTGLHYYDYHSKKQISMVQFDTALRMTPFGAAVKMLTMHKNQEVASESTGMDSKGAGLGSLATMDDTGLVVEVWNLQSTETTVSVAVRNIHEKWRSSSFQIRQYLIDSPHSNCFSAPKSSGGLEKIAETERPASGELKFEVRLEPMALYLWTVEPTN